MHSQQQSPIDLGSTIFTDYGSDALKIRWRKSARGEIVPGPHGKKRVSFNARQSDYVSLDGSQFHLVGFHFHWPSEHWVEDSQQPMELHMVHQNTNRENGARTVLGVFIEEGKKVGTKRSSQGNDKAPISTSPWDWIPDNVGQYYRYEGSLTTWPFTENVHWIVFRQPLVCPRPLFALLKKQYCESARLPQPLHRRFLLANFK